MLLLLPTPAQSMRQREEAIFISRALNSGLGLCP